MTDESTVSGDGDVKAEIIRLQEWRQHTSRDLQEVKRMIQESQDRQTTAIEKLAGAFNAAFENAAQRFVSKVEMESILKLLAQKSEEQAKEISFLRKILLGFCAFILVGFMGAVASQVFVK